MSILSYRNLSNTSILKIIGDVKTVLHGYIDDTNMNPDVLRKLKFALGAGSFSDCTCAGETVVLNQIGYSCHVDTTGKLITCESASGLKSPFLMGLQLDCHPSSLLQIDYPQGIALDDLFKNIGAGYSGYAYVGCLLFKNLACSYIKKPPIYKENINENSEQYWATTENHADCCTYVFGVVIKEKGAQDFPSDTLKKAFYVNPLEKNKGSLLSHTHAVLTKNSLRFSDLKQDNQFYDNLEINAVTGVRHVFTQSVVEKGLLAVFNIDDIEAEE